MVGGGDINFARNYSLVCAEIFGNAVRVWFLKGEEEFVESMRENYIRLETRRRRGGRRGRSSSSNILIYITRNWKIQLVLRF